ncbi:MAG: TatD family hydrolase [Kangiellaceae bacterium]|jgi:TatD DNase family protein|nr:TatD family hydrolase [Kangiellaceae bacterium]
MLVDSHCHLDRIDLTPHNNNLGNALAYAAAQGVDQFLCIATDQSNFNQVLSIANDHESVNCTVGIHPLSDDLSTESTLAFLIDGCKHDKVVAIGETGLDTFYAPDSLAAQKESFAVHIEAANQTNMPLIIHTRQAKEDTLAMVGRLTTERPGVLHCFTEDWDMAKRAIDKGFYISISGIVTFKQAENVRDVAKKIPLDRLLVETDSPYLAPVPFRGKPCQPAYTRKTAEFLAELRNETLEELAQQTTKNYLNLFNLA